MNRNPPKDVAGYDPIGTAGECVYDPAAAQQAVDFFSKGLRLTRGRWSGQPFKLQKWQEAYIRTLWGWKNPDGSRRYRMSLLFIPRKNGKSQLAAGIALASLFLDKEAEAQCYCAASDREQASLVFHAAASMVRATPGLAKKVTIRDSLRRINHKPKGHLGGSFLRAIPANEGGAHGFDSHLIVGDELHTWPNRDFFDTLHTSTGARDQPLEVYITTAGHDRESICHEVYKRACAIRDGQVEDAAFLPAIYEAQEGDDWKKPATWAKANPNLGASLRREYLAAECKKAIENPAYENTFKRLHLNMWTEQDERWLPMDSWEACQATSEPPENDEPQWAGLDIASVRDFTAFVRVARWGDVFKAWGHYWLPEKRVDYLARKHNIPLEQWVRDGWVTAIPGAEMEDRYLIDHVAQVARNVDLRSVGFDRWGSPHVRQTLEQDHGVTMVAVAQGARSLSAPSKTLERCVIGGRLDHSGDPVLRWMAGNVAIKRDENNNIRPVKGRGATYKHIDGVVALIMAIGEAEAGDGGGSIFDGEWDF